MNIVMEDVILTTHVCLTIIAYSTIEWIPILSNGGMFYSRLHDQVYEIGKGGKY